MRKNKFTLVELLVVIAIISILAAMLLPTLEESLFITRNVICLNHLKQHGLFSLQFENDYQRLPRSSQHYGVHTHFHAVYADNDYKDNDLIQLGRQYYSENWVNNIPVGSLLNCPGSRHISSVSRKRYCYLGVMTGNRLSLSSDRLQQTAHKFGGQAPLWIDHIRYRRGDGLQTGAIYDKNHHQYGHSGEARVYHVGLIDGSAIAKIPMPKNDLTPNWGLRNVDAWTFAIFPEGIFWVYKDGHTTDPGERVSVGGKQVTSFKWSTSPGGIW